MNARSTRALGYAVLATTALVIGCQRDPTIIGEGGPGPDGTPGDGADDNGDTAADTMGDDADGGTLDDGGWAGTAFTGELHGLLQVTFSPAHPLRSADALGMSGGYRTAEASWAAEDFYSPIFYLLPFPNAPAAVDSVAYDMALTAFDFGGEADWVAAGNGMILRRSDEMGSVVACRQDYVVDTEGSAGTFPIYATGSSGDPQCIAEPSVWAAETEFDVLLFGGQAFGTNELLGRVTTPPDLEVTSPDLATLDQVIPASSDLAFAWNASGVDTRIVIRIVDQAGAVLSAHAMDDGAFTISAADLSMLQPGAIDVIVARERSDRMLFTDGGLTVVSRYERWGFFELGE